MAPAVSCGTDIFNDLDSVVLKRKCFPSRKWRAETWRQGRVTISRVIGGCAAVSHVPLCEEEEMDRLQRIFGAGGGGAAQGAVPDQPLPDTAETIHISSLALLKMLKQ